MAKKVVALVLNAGNVAISTSGLNLFAEMVENEHRMLSYYYTGRSYEREKRYLRTVDKNQLQAVVIFTQCPPPQMDAYVHWLKREFVERDIQVILYNRKTAIQGITSIRMDNETIGYEVTRYLMSTGRREIAHISGTNTSGASASRYLGYSRALKEAGIRVDPNLVVSGDYTAASGEEAMHQLLFSKVPFSAVFSANDAMAIGAIKALQKSGYRIPEDVAVMGVDDLFVSSMLEPSLSSVHISIRTQWQKIAQCILDAAAGKDCPEHMDMPFYLVPRQSTGCLMNTAPSPNEAMEQMETL